jgi:excisionase family DNA binding protein
MIHNDYTACTEPLACSVRDARHMIGISHTKIYELIADGSLKTVKIGKKRLVLVDSIHELLRPAA